MGKVSPVSAKYIIHANINVQGVVDRPDVIGAIFGQTEGLLGPDLELRELQRSGRIGRIEVNLNTQSGKTTGEITIPSSMDKAETCIVAATLEVVQRIGPCKSTIEVEKVEDVRISKRNFVIDKAKDLLKGFTEQSLPDSQEITQEVAQSVRAMEVQEYGKDKLPAGPSIDESDEVIIVEGRADVLNLIKNGIKNCIALEGTSVPQTIIDLSRRKIMTAFVDGDRGGDLIIKELLDVAEIDFVCEAPDGKEVEEISKKEIHKSLRGKVAAEQIKMEIDEEQTQEQTQEQKTENGKTAKEEITEEKQEKFAQILDELLGTRAACLLDENLNTLTKIPVNQVKNEIEKYDNVFALVLDGSLNKEIRKTVKEQDVSYIVSTTGNSSSQGASINIMNSENL